MYNDRIPNVILYAGPSLAGVPFAAELTRGIRVMPPVRRRDVEAQVMSGRGTPGVLLIADGAFHQCLAVGHAELRLALERGWVVWGVSSMGAIRACEMRSLGMRGFGRVFDMFVAEEDFQDDEVAMLHESEPPYRAFSEPLVHARAAIQTWTASGLLSRDSGIEIVGRLKALWYGERTMELLRQLVLDSARPADRADLAEDLDDFGPFRVKSLDLAQFLRERPWERSAAALGAKS